MARNEAREILQQLQSEIKKLDESYMKALVNRDEIDIQTCRTRTMSRLTAWKRLIDKALDCLCLTQ